MPFYKNLTKTIHASETTPENVMQRLFKLDRCVSSITLFNCIYVSITIIQVLNFTRVEN